MSDELHENARQKEIPCHEEIVMLGTGIKSLDALLRGGIFFHKGSGLFGVITGPTGVGKSILGMELCTKFALGASRSGKPRSAIFISQEAPELLKTKIAKTFHFFSTGPQKPGTERPTIVVNALRANSMAIPDSESARGGGTGPRSVTQLGQFINDRAAIYLCQIGLDARSQKGMLENIIDLVAETTAKFPSGEDHWDRILVCIDSVNSIDENVLTDVMLLKQCSSEGTAVPPGAVSTQVRTIGSEHNGDPLFYRRLRECCSRRRINAFLIFEQKHQRGRDNVVSDVWVTPEEYAADIAIRLGVHMYESGYSQRFLEIIKSRNQFYHRGRHYCSIVSERKEQEGKEQEGGGDRPEEPVHEVGLVIYPSVATQLTWLREESRSKKAKAGGADAAGAMANKRLGIIKSVDKRIAYLIPPQDRGSERAAEPSASGQSPDEGYIVQGSSSVLVSDLDVKATEIGLHFALGAERSLFISFLQGEDDLRKTARRFHHLKSALSSDHHTLKYYSPEHIGEGKLLRDIDLQIHKSRGGDPTEWPRKSRGDDAAIPLVVVVDNVFELECKYPLLRSAKHFLAALLELFRVRRVTSFIIDTVEAGEARNPIEVSFAAGLVDNVFLLRHVEFQSRPHHVFSVLKLLGTRTPEVLWDLEEEVTPDGSELVARDTFELYRNVLSGQPVPVTITLALYMDAEGSPFHRYLQAYAKALKESFGRGTIVTSMYGAEEYARVQEVITAARARQRADCHIVHLDEFWLKRLIENQSLEELSEYIYLAELGEDFKDRNQYVSAAHDIVMYQIRQNPELSKRYGIDRDQFKQWHQRWYALPARNNCGILCCDPALVREVTAGLTDHLPERVKAWLEGNEHHGLQWADLVTLKGQFDGKKSEQPERYPKVFFTFCMDQMESYVSFLLELALSFGDRERMLQEAKLNIEAFPPEAFRTLLKLLDYSDIQTLASGVYRPSAEEPTALFSRQWMSTLGVLRSRKGKDASGDYFSRLRLLELPLGPGKQDPTPVSGTWYLGILKGSIAMEAGMRVIAQATSKTDEVYKLNNYIGLPVRRVFYEGGNDRERTPFPLPYRKRYADLAKIQDGFLKDPESDSNYIKSILESDYPFYRVLIDDYYLAAPVLWRLLVRVARGAVTYGPVEGTEAHRIDEAIQSAAAEYRVLTKV